MPERQESGRSYPDTHAEFRKRDREYFELIGRNVICGNRVLPIIAFQWLRFGAGHLFTLQLPDGREMGAQRDEFYVLPTRDEIEDVIRPIESTGSPSRQSAMADAVLALFTTSTQGETQP